MSNTAEELKDTLNDIERDVYDGIDLGDMFTKAYVLADELGESIDKLREESAKLRELARDMYAAMVVDAENCDVTYPEQFDGRMRELGVEL